MKITFTLLLAFCLCSLSLFAQNNYSIKGAAVDTDLRIKLYNTSVTVLNAKDSILVKYTRAAENGSFVINGLPSGKFTILISYPEYADYVETITLDAATPLHDFGTINMRLKEKILKEVMIKGEVRAIKIKGDTTEFNAKAYVTQPNAKVEDLLKQLPGIQVDKDGKITANGEAVNKVLLDGEEFFGDDPTLVTKNIRADMVDKVQLFDKKSDQAAFTGIDDGIKTKTINIKLKEDKKSGVFGKLDAGVGNEGFYEGEALYNRFKAKQKYSVYATTANDGKMGLGYADNDKIGASTENVVIDGGVSIIYYGQEDDTYYNGEGFPLSRTAGVHFDNKWDADKQSINLNYKVGSLEVTGAQNTLGQQSLPGAVNNTNTDRTYDNFSFKQKLSGTYEVKLDTSSNLKIIAGGQTKHNETNSTYLTTTNRNDTLINRQDRKLSNISDQNIFNVSAFYTKKFKKPRRTFSWNVSEAYNQTRSHGYENSELDFYNAQGARDSSQLVNQYKTTNSTSSVFGSNMTYTEPITKRLSIIINYGLSINNSTADRKSFDQSAPGVYNILDNTYSNDYKFNQLINQAGVAFSYKSNKTTLTFTNKISDVNFKQLDEYTGAVYNRNFVNWTPQGLFQYRASQQSSLSLYYNGSTTQPTIDEIQPVQVNTDPLNLTIGNPNLKPSFTNRFNLNYNLFHLLSGQQMYIGGNYSITSNPIINNTTTSATGVSTVQYVNLEGKDPYNYSLYAQFSRKVKPLNFEFTPGLSFNTTGNISYSYINGLLNTSKSYTNGVNLRLQKSEQKKYEIYISAGPNYTINEFSLQPQSSNNAAGFNGYEYSTFFLPKKFQISTDANYQYTAKTQTLTEQNVTIFNASISKTFMKDDNLKLTISGHDLFNQNNNFSRNITANSITQNTYNGIKRYFMVQVTWDFTKFGTTAATKN